MKLLLDQGLPRSAVRLLREAGIDSLQVGEIGLSTANDSTILQRARNDQRVVVTLDADFGALLAISRATSPSVIRIRLEGLYGQKAADIIQTVLEHCAEDLEKGAVVTVQSRGIRIRNLPLLP
jgi:predicted nuclease of predicted toxin-antitoxin system